MISYNMANVIATDGVKMSTIQRKTLPLDHKAALLILSCYMNINNIPRYIYICKQYLKETMFTVTED